MPLLAFTLSEPLQLHDLLEKLEPETPTFFRSPNLEQSYKSK